MALVGPDWHREEIGACLRVGQMELAGLEIDVFPSQRLDFGEPAAREHEQPNCGYGGAGLRAIFVDCVEDTAEACEFVLCQEPLARLLPVALLMQARVRAVGPKPPELGEVEHLREHREGAVGLVRSATDPSLGGKLEGYEVADFKECHNHADCVPGLMEFGFVRDGGIVLVGGRLHGCGQGRSRGGCRHR